jgi:hypothetical protein
MTGTADSHSPECVIPDDVLIQFGPPDDEHLLLETCRGEKINTLRKSASSWSLSRIARSKLQWQVREFVTQMEGWPYCGSGS